MGRILKAVLVLCLAGISAEAAHTKVRLVLAAETARPGDTVLAAVQLRMDKGWHTYWKNSGQSGLPTTIAWDLPPGITAEDVKWPLPEKVSEEGLTTYSYKDEVLLLVPLKLGSQVKHGVVELKAQVSWLECEVKCIPGDTNVSASLKIDDALKPSSHVQEIAAWEKRLPRDAKPLNPRAAWEKEAKGDTRPLLIEWTSAEAAKGVDFFPSSSDAFEVQPAVETLPAPAGKMRLRAEVKKLSGDWPAQISGVLVEEKGNERSGYELNLPLQAGSESAPLKTASLWTMLFYAFLGGLILNVMPCVLPVIALKILGFVGQAAEQPGRVRKLGLVYASGVIISFLIFAALVIGLKAAGHRAGWGMQFSNPQFLVAMTVLVTLVALNLFGLFEVNLSGRVMGAAGSLASRHGAAGAFFDGVLATILATPCTAPFLAPALGFAFSQPAPVILLIFISIGIGLSLPYVLLSWHPAWLKFLPKPGPWMEKFKVAMGFPMLATAFWLFQLMISHYGQRAWWMGIFLITIALAAWIFGEFVQRGTKHRGLASTVAVVVLLAGYVGILEAMLHWRAVEEPQVVAAKAFHAPKGIDWQPWSSEAVNKARSEGRPVLVDFTAEWCLTCNTIVKPALESAAVRQKIQEINATALLADYTRVPPVITDELKKFGRVGVPLVLVYPKDSAQPPMVYDVVTSGTLIEALNKAGVGM